MTSLILFYLLEEHYINKAQVYLSLFHLGHPSFSLLQRIFCTMYENLYIQNFYYDVCEFYKYLYILF